MSINADALCTLLNWLGSHPSGVDVVDDAEKFDDARCAYASDDLPGAVRAAILCTDLSDPSDNYGAALLWRAMKGATAAEIAAIMLNDGQRFNVGTDGVDLIDLVKAAGGRQVYSSGSDKVWSLSSGHIATTDGGWDLVEYDKDGTPDKNPWEKGAPGGWRSVERDGGWGRDGWFFSDPE